MSDFHAAERGYAATSRVNVLHATEYPHPDEGGHGGTITRSKTWTSC